MKDDTDYYTDTERPPHATVGVHPRKELRCYEVLGLTRTAASDQVRQAYKKRALQAHPDRPHGEHASFLSIAEAFETLSDHNKRDLYDRELVVADSQDGLQAFPRRRFAAHGERTFYDQAAMEDAYQNFMTLPASEWAKSIVGLDTILLEGLLAHLEKVSDEPQGSREDKQTDQSKSTSSDPVLKSAAKGMHLYCTGGNFWCAQVVINGLEVRSMTTRSVGTAASGHVALLAYKEFLLAHTREEREHNFEACSRAALAQALAQNLDVAGDHFAYSFRKVVKLHGEMQNFRTPAGRDLDTTLRHRKELLEMIGRGCSAAQIVQRIARMRLEVSESSMHAIGSRRRMQCLLAGYVHCELEQRSSNEMSEPKRRRLLGKQSDALVHFRLPWFSQFAKHHSLNRSQLLPHLQSLQECLQRSPHLQECVQGALMKCLEDPVPTQSAMPSNGQRHSDDERDADSRTRDMAEGGKIAQDMTHDSCLSGSTGSCTGRHAKKTSSDEAGTVRDSVPGGQQPHGTKRRRRAKDRSDGKALGPPEDRSAGMAETNAVFAAAAGDGWVSPKDVLSYDMGDHAKAKLGHRHLETQIQGLESAECNSEVKQTNSGSQTADDLVEAQMWSWTAALFSGTSPAPGSVVVEVD